MLSFALFTALCISLAFNIQQNAELERCKSLLRSLMAVRQRQNLAAFGPAGAHYDEHGPSTP